MDLSTTPHVLAIGEALRAAGRRRAWKEGPRTAERA